VLGNQEAIAKATSFPIGVDSSFMLGEAILANGGRSTPYALSYLLSAVRNGGSFQRNQV